MQVGKLLGADHRFENRWRQDRVTQAQLRQQGFGEGADVGDDAALVEAMQRIGRTPFVAKFAVVVVLDDDRPQFMRASQQGFAARRAHRHAQRKLMRRRDINQPRAIRDVFDLYPLGIHGNTDHLGAMGAEQQACRRIARIFHRHQAAGADQHASDQVQRLLRAVAHHDVFVLTVDPARKRDVPGNRIAQRRQAFGHAVETFGRGHLAHGVGDAAAPVVMGELALAGGATDEVVAQRTLQRRMAQEHRQVAPTLDHRCTGQLGVALLALDLRRARIDVGAFADHAGEEVFVRQLRVSVGNGLARNTQLLGQQTAGR